MSYQVLIGGIDVTNYVISIETTPLEKPAWGEIATLPEATITVENVHNAFSPYSDSSFMAGYAIKELSLEVYSEQILRWKGFIADIQTNVAEKKATITGESKLSRELNKASKAYFGQDTPSEIARQVLLLHNVEIDDTSFALAENYLNDVPVHCLLNPSVSDWTGTLGDILQLFAVAGIARFFATLDGKIGMDTYTSIEGIQQYELTDDDLEQWPEIEVEGNELLRGYQIDYLYGTEEEIIEGVPVTSSLQTIDLGVNSAVSLVDAGGAVYIGERWLELSQIQFYRGIFYFRHEVSDLLDMNSWVRINSVALGFNNVCEVIGIDLSDKRFGVITLRWKNA